MRCRSVRVPVVLFVAASSFALAGCGAKASLPDQPRSALADAGPAPVDPATPDASPPAPVAVEVPFGQAFAASSGFICSSQGAAQYTVTLPTGEYQFGNCAFRITPTQMPNGTISVSVEDPTEVTWRSTVTPIADTPGELGVTLYQPRGAIDWSEAPLHVRFDFASASGHPLFTRLVLRPSESHEIATFHAPRLETSHYLDELVAGVTAHHAWPSRRDAAGIPVLRLGEPFHFEIPFELAANVDARDVAGTRSLCLNPLR